MPNSPRHPITIFHNEMTSLAASAEGEAFHRRKRNFAAFRSMSVHKQIYSCVSPRPHRVQKGLSFDPQISSWDCVSFGEARVFLRGAEVHCRNERIEIPHHNASFNDLELNLGSGIRSASARMVHKQYSDLTESAHIYVCD